MCEHCGYKPGESRIIQTVTIFEKEPDERGGTLGVHFEAADPGYIESPEFESKHNAEDFLYVAEILDGLLSMYVTEGIQKAVEGPPINVTPYRHLSIVP